MAVEKPSYRFVLLINFLLLHFIIVLSSPRIRFNYLNCEATEYGEEYGEILNCGLRVVARGRQLAHGGVKLKKNISSLWIKGRLMKRENTWHPFLYSVEGDPCDFLRNRRKYYLLNVVYPYALKYIKYPVHKCPYLAGEILAAEGLEASGSYLDEVLARFPIPLGTYGVFVEGYKNNQLLGTVNCSWTYDDYSKLD